MVQLSPWTAAPAVGSSSRRNPLRAHQLDGIRWGRDSGMRTIDLAYVERGVHEELVAYVADRNGVSWDPERLRRGASIGLGRALLQRLTDGIGWKVLSVNTHRPLFWFLGNAEVTSMADLRGRRVAVHP